MEDKTRRLASFFDGEPDRFRHSRGYFRMMVLATVLQRDLGVRTTDKLNDFNAALSDSRDLFLHGVLLGGPGNCSSLPYLYAAIGHRLGYPLSLVQRPAHLFLRWDDNGGDRFNVECTTPGLVTPPDEYYWGWPFLTTPAEAEGTYYFRPLTPREQFAGCLIQRAYCLAANGRHREAVLAAAWSYELTPHHQPHEHTLSRLLDGWRRSLEKLMPSPFPRLTIGFGPPRFSSLPLELEREIIHLGVVEDLGQTPELRAAYSGCVPRSPRSGVPLGLPDHIAVNCRGVTWLDDMNPVQPLRRQR